MFNLSNDIGNKINNYNKIIQIVMIGVIIIQSYSILLCLIILNINIIDNIMTIQFNSVLYYLCAESTARRPVTDTAQCNYR
jgi:hypothetical protein